MKGGKLEVGIGKGLELDDIVEAHRSTEEKEGGREDCAADLGGVDVAVRWVLASFFRPSVSVGSIDSSG